MVLRIDVHLRGNQTGSGRLFEQTVNGLAAKHEQVEIAGDLADQPERFLKLRLLHIPPETTSALLR